ncbi:response regulator [Actinoplanes sp. CA-054009]
MTTRVVLVDDQAIVRAGLTALLQGGDDERVTVVGEASDGAQVVGLVRRTRPDVVLMDVRMPGVGGVAATRALRADPECAGVAVLMLTTFDTDDEVLGALRAGADGYLLKDAEPARLRAAVRAAAFGEPVLSPEVARRIMATAADSSPPPPPDPRLTRLSRREREVLVAIADGRDNTEVAREMRLSPDTVRTYVSRILTKTGASSRAQLVAIAHRSGLMEHRLRPR